MEYVANVKNIDRTAKSDVFCHSINKLANMQTDEKIIFSPTLKE
jgi:hypothetical protein